MAEFRAAAGWLSRRTASAYASDTMFYPGLTVLFVLVAALGAFVVILLFGSAALVPPADVTPYL